MGGMSFDFTFLSMIRFNSRRIALVIALSVGTLSMATHILGIGVSFYYATFS